MESSAEVASAAALPPFTCCTLTPAGRGQRRGACAGAHSSQGRVLPLAAKRREQLAPYCAGVNCSAAALTPGGQEHQVGQEPDGAEEDKDQGQAGLVVQEAKAAPPPLACA